METLEDLLQTARDHVTNAWRDYNEIASHVPPYEETEAYTRRYAEWRSDLATVATVANTWTQVVEQLEQIMEARKVKVTISGTNANPWTIHIPEPEPSQRIVVTLVQRIGNVITNEDREEVLAGWKVGEGRLAPKQADDELEALLNDGWIREHEQILDWTGSLIRVIRLEKIE